MTENDEPKQETGVNRQLSIDRALADPFPIDEVQWKPVHVIVDMGRCLVVPFYDVRLVYDRLDGVVGPMNWQIRHAPIAAGQAVLTEIGIRNPDTGEWVWKGDIGMTDRSDEAKVDASTKTKGDASDGAKRAGALWGIGRCYWKIPKDMCWVDWDRENKQPKSTPNLPDWARPYAARKKPGGSTQATTATAAEGQRPYNCSDVRGRILAQADRLKGTKEPAGKAKMGVLMGMLNVAVAGDGCDNATADARRKQVLQFLFGKDSGTKLEPHEILAALRWVKPVKTLVDGAEHLLPGPHVTEEAALIVRQMEKADG